jgi:glycerol-3-phosphate dehydrogenase
MPDDYNDVLLDKIMEMRSKPNFADGAVRYLAEAEMNPNSEDILLRKANTYALLEIARLLNMIHQRP